MRVVITGSMGSVAGLLVPRLARSFDLTLVSRRPPVCDPPEHLQIDLDDVEGLVGACEGADAVVHLAGESHTFATWDQLVGPNVTGLVNLFEAARRAGVMKVVFASSNHVTGMYDLEKQWPIGPGQPIRPDSPYGVTKAFGEAMGRYYSDNFGIAVICLRIGWALERPHNEVARFMWLSPDDLARLVTGALLSTVRFGIYYGVSDNTQRHWAIDNAQVDLGYEPQDDSEVYFAGPESRIDGDDDHS